MPHGRDDHIIESREPLPALSNAYSAPGAREQYHLADGVSLAASDPLQDGHGVAEIEHIENEVTVPSATTEFIYPEAMRGDQYRRVLDSYLEIDPPAPVSQWVLSVEIEWQGNLPQYVTLSQWIGTDRSQWTSSLTPGDIRSLRDLRGRVFGRREIPRFTVSNNDSSIDLTFTYHLRLAVTPNRVKPPER